MKERTEQFRVSERSGSVRELLALASPLVIAHMSQSLVWIVDVFLMRWIGNAEQGAVGLAGLLFWTTVCLFAGTMTIISVLVAQDFGAGKPDLARHVRTGIVLIVPMSIVMIATGSYMGAGLGVLGISDQARPHADAYLHIRFFGSPLLLMSFVLSSFLRGIGDTLTPMIAAIAANVFNLIAAVILVFGLLGFPAMGVSGAAWAAVAASTVEATIYAAFYFWGTKARGHGARTVALPSIAELGRFLALGIPVGIGFLFETIAWAAFSVYAGGRPPEELAAHTVLFQFCGFCFAPAMSISIATSVLVGQYIGAQRIDLARKSAINAVKLGAGYMACVGVVLALFRYPLFHVFNSDVSVVAVGTTIALIGAVYQPFDGFSIVCQGILRGAKQTTTPTLIMLASGFLVFIPLVRFLGDTKDLGIRGAWIASVVHVVVVALLSGIAVRRSRVFLQHCPPKTSA